jgi:hypothetical protein
MLGIWPEALKKQGKGWIKTTIICLILAWMAFYPIYSSYYKANAIDHYRRHLEHVKGNSMFFNPWQYRILCPLIIEGMYWTAEHTVFRIVEIRGIDLGIPSNSGEKNSVTAELMQSLKNPEFVKYTLVFLAFRFSLNVVLLLLCFYYFSLFVKNSMLVAFGLMIATLFMGNSVVDSDLTFNTYMEIVLYIAAGIVIVKQLNPWLIVLFTLLGALNRETAVFIPVLYFFSRFSWKQWPSISKMIGENSSVVLITGICAILFVGIFVSIRMYYGLRPVSTWRVSAGWPMFKLNLLSSVSLKSYMELFGVFGFLPIWCILILSKMEKNLKLFFITLVPVWFILHFTTAIAYQTRLFLVPTLLVLLPAVLANLEMAYQNKQLRPVK